MATTNSPDKTKNEARNIRTPGSEEKSEITYYSNVTTSLSPTSNHELAAFSRDSSEDNRPKSRRKRSLLFPSGTDMSFTVAFQIPITALSATSTTLDIDIPFSYDLPASVTTARKLEDEHAAVLEMAEDLMNKFGINGKSCVLRLICELAETQGLPYNGLLGKAMETLFLIDYGMSSTERLYEYISARAYGEHEGNCHDIYTGCPFSVFNLIDSDLLHGSPAAASEDTPSSSIP